MAPPAQAPSVSEFQKGSSHSPDCAPGDGGLDQDAEDLLRPFPLVPLSPVRALPVQGAFGLLWILPEADPMPQHSQCFQNV